MAQPAAGPQPPEKWSVVQITGRLSAEQATRSDRLAAAQQLVRAAQAQVPGAVDALYGSLANEQAVDVRRAVLDALAGCVGTPPSGGLVDAVLAMREDLPAELEAGWARALGRYELERIAGSLFELAGDEQAELGQRRLAIRALGEHRRLFAAKHLVDLTSVNRLKQVQGWAFDALAGLSHQPRLGRDREAWAGWYNSVRNMSASEWQRMLHENLLRHTREQTDFDKQVRDRLIRSQRALYLATAPEGRPALLVQLLKDPLDAMRLLGLELARQRAEDNGEFGDALRDELRNRLDDPRARIREESATLLGQLLDENAADLMAERLAEGQELEAAVRRAYLLALTQLPRAEALQPAYDTLDHATLSPFAAGLLAAAHRAGQGEQAFWQGVARRVREGLEGIDAPRPQMVTLLGLVIAEDDTEGWTRIGGWLDAEDDRVRESAARVWAGSNRSLAVLAERSDDVVIRPIALKAIAERGNRQQTLSAVASRRPAEPDDIRLWEQAMIALAGRVPADALLQTIDSLADKNGETRQVREHMLTAAIEREDKPDPPTRDDLRLLITRAQVRVLEDAPALVVLDYEAALKHADQLAEPQIDTARRGLTRAYLADGRIDDALKAVTTVLKPAGTLIDKAEADPLLDTMVAGAKQAAEQGRKDDAKKLIAGVRKLMGEAIAEPLDTKLKAIQAELDKPAVTEPAS